MDVDDALCAQTDPNLFFPEPGHTTQASAAKRICVACPITVECLELALAIPRVEDYGVWGATAQKERDVFRMNPKAKREFLINLDIKKKELKNGK